MTFSLSRNDYASIFFRFLFLFPVVRNSHQSVDVNLSLNEYIVKFSGFYSNNARKSILFDLLSPFNRSWSIVARPYDYVTFSDFEVINIDERFSGDIKRRLSVDATVRGIDRNALITERQLLFFDNHKSKGHKISYYLQADMLWSMGIRGQGVRVAIFDTGIDADHSHFKRARLIESTNWTNEPHSRDTIGHGTFVAGMFVSSPDNPDDSCPSGISPDIDLYVFRVFTHRQTSYTSWFLDAFNYAMARNIDLINLSIGGPDFQDKPFVEKVWELSAHGVLLVSAIGNDGPLYGTLNNPADQMDVIGVGGIDFQDNIARFSSRGMTTWEIPGGYGRVKPDIVTHGSQIVSSSLDGSCRTLSGTSVASPSVAAAVALLICAAKLINKASDPPPSPASIKQAVLSSATRLSGTTPANIFEQGMGKLNLIVAYRTILESRPQASAYPSYIDLTEQPYMWPYSSQPLYSSALPIIINITVMNSMAVSGVFLSSPVYHAISHRNGDRIRVSFSYSPVLWPWTGYLAVEITVPSVYADWEGIVEGYITADIQSRNIDDGHVLLTHLKIPLRARVVPQPSRNKRILWDQFHNLRYPPGYIPRDNIRRQEPLDWTGDHIHTNFKDTFDYLRSRGYFIEILGNHFGCFDASNYGTLIIMDSEEEFFNEERKKLFKDITENGLSVIVIAEWYNVKVMKYLRFFDENTRQWWTPDTGGANIPALNNLLLPFNITFSDQVVEGSLKIGDKTIQYNSGTRLSNFPVSSTHISRILHTDQLKDIGEELLKGASIYVKNAAIMGFYSGPKLRRKNHGRIVVFGDSNCFDMTFRDKDCLWLWDHFLDFTTTGYIKPPLLSLFSEVKPDFFQTEIKPKRFEESRLHKFSSVINSQSHNKLSYREIPQCSRKSFAKIVIDNVSIPDESWFKPQPLLKKKIYHVPFGVGFKNYSPYQSINLDSRHPRIPRVVLQHSDFPRHYRVFWLYVICIISCCSVVLWWFCRRLRPKMREIRPIFSTAPGLILRNNF